ncbi:carbonic anhydrase 2-like [Malaya genurostris]|uniref:carbonic anhydrase 2-like n=1 Tax=Malaya genurostris TaxID=325434 RepID=UPI0026F3E8FE|nr:carbonic anhydrase 2-like [Malaya genurostris]
MKAHLVLLLYCLAVVQCDYGDLDGAENFGSGDFEWNEMREQCPGRAQSPIALDTYATVLGVERRPLELLGYQENPSQVVVTNNGYLAVYTFEYPNGQVITARGGPLRGTFQFDSLHFHWGEDSDRGAEHVVDGRRYAMEMHLVFYNTMYGSFMGARNQTNGLAVLGIFFNSTNTDVNYGWIPALSEVRTAGTSYTLPDPTVFNIKGLIGARRRPYYSYHGSLTTPPCFETVTWLVQRKPLPISEEQLDYFRSLRDGNGNPLVDNYRELQPINGRTVYFYPSDFRTRGK